MLLSQTFIALLTGFACLASANPTEGFGLEDRSLGGACKAPEGKGTCQHKSDCDGISYNGLCPNDAADIKCCVKEKCAVDGKNGLCASKDRDGCSGGTFHSGHCPGSSDIQCCIKNGGGGGGHPHPPPKDVGKAILAKAKTKKGVPYVFGGGNCKGPTHVAGKGTGFDCSGLLSYAICQVTGRNLFKEGLRVTRSMYCASPKKLKYKKVPFSQRRAGDAVFFGGSCDCKHNPKSIHHVGIMEGHGTKMWNALHTGTKVREDDFKHWTGKNKPCPFVIRF